MFPPFKRAVGVEKAKLEENELKQRASLPDSGFRATARDMCEALTSYMWQEECKRVQPMKNALPLYPMEVDWKTGQCTGVPLTLRRVMKPGPNFGRFYVMQDRPKFDADGDVILKENGYPETELVSFTFFDMTPYVRHGALAAVNKSLSEFFRSSHYGTYRGTTPTEEDLVWPAAEIMSNLAPQ